MGATTSLELECKVLAEACFQRAKTQPDVVLIIFTKNVSPHQGRTGVGIAAGYDIPKDQVRQILKWAEESLNDDN